MSEVAPAPLRTDNLLDAVEATLRAVDPTAFRVVPILRAAAGRRRQRDRAATRRRAGAPSRR